MDEEDKIIGIQEIVDDVADCQTKIKKKRGIYVVREKKGFFRRLADSPTARTAIIGIAGAATVGAGMAAFCGELYADDDVNPADNLVVEEGEQPQSEIIIVPEPEIITPDDFKIDFNLYGDFRAIQRYLRNRFYGAEDLDISDMRFRLFADADVGEDLSLGVRGGYEVSTVPNFDQRLQDGSEVYIDRAFLDYALANGVRLQLGAFGNTFTGWMDRDVPLVGGQLDFDLGQGLGFDLAGKLGYHVGQPWLDEADASMLGVELSGARDLSEDVKLCLAVNYLDFLSHDPDFIRTNARENGDYASDFNIVNAQAKLNWDTDRVPVFKGPVSLYAHGMYNLGADSDNLGVRVGVCLGGLKEQGDMMLKAELRHIEPDATSGAYAPKCTPCTNFDQLVFVGGYKITDNLSIIPIIGLPRRLDDDNRQVYTELGLHYSF